MIKTLAIETSCDDTSVGIINFDGKIFNVEKLKSYSQIKEHSQFGGVVPEVASRLHEEKILAVLQDIGLKNIEKVDFISVTCNPGLPGSLVVGKTVANTLGVFLKKKVICVNHILGHVFSVFLERNIEGIKFPIITLTASGGHNDIYLLSFDYIDLPLYEEINFLGKKLYIYKIGYTLDDAAGEAFDKVARMLGGPYPGGPWISNIAQKVLDDIEFFENQLKQIYVVDKDIVSYIDKKIKPIFLDADKFEFSFSGYKSQVWYMIQDLEKHKVSLNEEIKYYIAYKFQEAVIKVLVKKIIDASIKFNVKTISIVGGVSANERLFEYLLDQIEKFKNKGKLAKDIIALRPVKKVYSTDNAAMIGVVGLLKQFYN